MNETSEENAQDLTSKSKTDAIVVYNGTKQQAAKRIYSKSLDLNETWFTRQRNVYEDECDRLRSEQLNNRTGRKSSGAQILSV